MKHDGMRRMGAFALALLLLFALAAPALAANYTDVAEGYWGKPYIDELSTRGLFSGYEDGSFRPDAKITFCETLVLFSRLYPVDEQLRRHIDADYAEYVTETVPAGLSWANKELCVCLAAGIISKNEMSRVNLSAQINKQTFALLLVRTIGLRGQIKANMETELPLVDADKLISDYRGSVAILYSLGIVTGDQNNAFNPTEPVSRVIAAAMLSRALRYADGEGLKLRISAYDDAEDNLSGILHSIDESSLRIEQNNGLVREVAYNSGTSFTLNKSLILAGDAMVGSYARIVVSDGYAVSVELNAQEGQSYLSGEVDSAVVGGGGYIGLLRSDTGKIGLFPLSSGAVIVRNGAESSLSELQKGDHVIMNLRNDQVTEIAAFDYTETLQTKLLSLLLGDPTVLRAQDESGRIWVFTIAEKALPEVLRDGQSSPFRQLRPGDSAALEIADGKLSRVLIGTGSGESTEPSEPVEPTEPTEPSKPAETLDGILTSVIQSVSGNFWEITDAKGTVHRLSLSPSATATRGAGSISLSEIKIGDNLRVTVLESMITSVQIASAQQPLKREGKLISADETERKLVLQVKDQPSAVIIPDAAYILNAADGSALGFSSLTADSVLLVFGYEKENGFIATLVVVEQLAD